MNLIRTFVCINSICECTFYIQGVKITDKISLIGLITLKGRDLLEAFAALLVVFGLLGTVAFVIVGIVFAILKKLGVKKYLLISVACFALMIIGAIVMPAQPDRDSTATVNTNNKAEISNDKKTEVSESKKETTNVSSKQETDISSLPNDSGKEKPASVPVTPKPTEPENQYDVKIVFPVSKYPETAAHIREAIHQGESAICTIDRDGADENRDESLDGVTTKDGYDRDEWPMAMCAEGGEGADIDYVTPSDNRGAGSWVSNALEDYPDGTKVLFTFSEVAATTESKPTNAEPSTSTGKKPTTSNATKTTTEKAVTPQEKSTTGQSEVYFKNCTAVREAGAAPLYEGDPGYSRKLDRDGDGVACE